jgi:hypothetical protein
MALSDLSSAQVERLVELIKEKEAVQARLVQVQRALDSLVDGVPVEEKVLGKARGPRRSRRRASLKDSLLKELRSAGKVGLTVKELAHRIKAKPTSVSVWFYTTGKKLKGIKKVSPGHFTLVG